MTTEYWGRESPGVERNAVDASQQDKNKDITARLTTAFPVSGGDYSTLPTAAAMERAYIGRVLEATGYNKTKAAEVLDLDRRTLHRKLKRYELADRATGQQTAASAAGSAEVGYKVDSASE